VDRFKMQENGEENVLEGNFCRGRILRLKMSGWSVIHMIYLSADSAAAFPVKHCRAAWCVL
ncbi:hypothetical protein, partial [Prevotella intermedia]|uniref:hypothetical protein n=1 Tax=Prevotella intermedia TaxID=28131 RepID=UPI0005EAD129